MKIGYETAELTEKRASYRAVADELVKISRELTEKEQNIGSVSLLPGLSGAEPVRLVTLLTFTPLYWMSKGIVERQAKQARGLERKSKLL